MNPFPTFWHYHSDAAPSRQAKTLQGAQPEGIKPASIDADHTDFQISLDTFRYRPNYTMTLRTNVDGWGRDIHGAYWWGAWRFVLPKKDYANGCEFKFLLNGHIWEEGYNHVIDGPNNTHLNESHVSFQEPPGSVPPFQHSLENLRVMDDQQQQNLLRSHFSEAEYWDVIVIGSGMGGGILADALSDAPGERMRILVLDAGSLDYPTHIYNLPVTGIGRLEGGHQVRHYDNVDGNQRFGEYVQMNLGGRSVFWSGLIPRMKGWELQHWPAEVREYLENGGYDDAEKLMRKHVAAGKYQEDVIQQLRKRFPGWEIVNTPRSFHQPEFGPEENPEAHPASFLFHSTGCFSTAELLLDSINSGADPGKGLHVNLNHLVTHLEHDGAQVTGVVCQDLVGNRVRRYRGKYVVLAAGSLESVKIALQSGLDDPHGKIGVGLTDHPSYYAPDDHQGGTPFFLRDDSPFAGADKHARIFFYPEQDWEGHWFNIEVVINGRYWRERHADDDVIRIQHPPTERTRINFKFVFGSPLQEDNWARLPEENRRLLVKHGANPTAENARPAVLNLLRQLLDFFQAEPVDLDNPGNCHYGNGGTVNHAGGTMRMGRQGEPRVVDENLKHESYRNLYVCDPSVYPFIPAANPSLTLAALSLRLADHLTEKIQNSPAT